MKSSTEPISETEKILPIELITRTNTTTVGIVVLNAELKVMYVGKTAKRFLQRTELTEGISFAKVIKKVQFVYGRDDISEEDTAHLLHSILQEKGSRQFYLEVEHGDVPMWLMVEAVKTQVGKGGESGILLTLTDVTKLKQQQLLLSKQMAEISDQNRQWQAMYNGMPESIVLLNTDGRVLTMNPATERITGYKTSEGIGMHVGELFPKIDAMVPGVDIKGRSGLHQTLEDERTSDLFEAIVATKDGRHLWVNYTYTPLKDAKGTTTALVRVTSDVSTVKAVEQMKNDFVSIASHELRTPLGVINSYLTLFLNGQLGELTDDQKTYMQRVYSASGDMSALVEDLLNMSRIESGRVELAVQPFYMRDLIREVLSHLEQRVHAKKIKVKVREPKHKFLVHADRQKVEQALTNIIDNAIKYTYDGGQITVAAKSENGNAIVTIKDSGVGIKPENLGHVFEKFYREGNPLSVKEGGSGLGLYISRKLIELHGGVISVTSKRRVGSTFTITLPLSTDQNRGV